MCQPMLVLPHSTHNFYTGLLDAILVPPQEIQMELTMRDGVVDAMRLQAHKLLQGVGGCHINAASIHAKLDNLGRRWDHLQKLAQERYVSPWLHIWFHSILVFDFYIWFELEFS